MKRLNRAQWLRKQKRFERNILEMFLSATAADIIDGKAWYPHATAKLAELAPQWGIEKRAAVCAIISPRITWRENIIGFRKLVNAARNHSSVTPVMAGLNRNIQKAYDVAGDHRGIEAVSGPKVSCFYANLSGNLERVTLDVWAGRAAGLTIEETNSGIRGKRYEYLEQAYINVAHELGFQPAELQAICWIVVRGKGE